ncbi:translation machinery-associated protein 16 [Podospora didyma]|uniref:Translation machinery-associated protein 16 n=1 Tax=Podospora didyma TaxID=330526 RepID=A0AAE0NP21_9PEZI|nr:translation machinery-associated protein 16 [Podospora didyma]
MPNTLEKTRKKILRKRNGVIDGLHQNSRDSMRLHTAQGRDEKLEKLARTRKQRDKPLLDRVAFFQEVAEQNENKPLELGAIQAKIHDYVHQFDEEFSAIKKTRRAGRPASATEDLLKIKIATLEKEQKNGFYMPDLANEETLSLLDRWEGSWSYLANLSWVKISATGVVKPALFPPQSN